LCIVALYKKSLQAKPGHIKKGFLVDVYSASMDDQSKHRGIRKGFWVRDGSAISPEDMDELEPIEEAGLEPVWQDSDPQDRSGSRIIIVDGMFLVGSYWTNEDLSRIYADTYNWSSIKRKKGLYFGSCIYCGVPAPEKVYRKGLEVPFILSTYWVCPSCGKEGISPWTDKDGRSLKERPKDPWTDNFSSDNLSFIAKLGGIIVIAVFVLFVVFNSCRSCADLCEGKGRACMETCTEERYDDAWRYGS